MTQYSALDGAMERREVAFKALQAAPHPTDPVSRRAYREACEANLESEKCVRNCYAREMLPRILGGEWRETGRGLYVRRGYYREFIAGNHHDLLDHWKHYRQLGARGPSSFKNTLIIAHPYNLWPRESRALDAELHSGICATAKECAARYGVGIWARPDLSVHYPGWTSMVLFAGGLAGRADDAGAFGFVALA